MKRLARSIIPILALVVAAGVANTAARASEEPPVVRALLDSAAINAAARPTYASIDVAADGTITLTDYVTTFEAESDPAQSMSYRIGSLTLSGVSEIAAGMFEVAEAEWSRIAVTAGGESVAAIPLVTAGSMYVLQPGKEPTATEQLRASNVLAREFEMPEALLLVAGQGVVVEDLSGTWNGDPMTGSGTSNFSVRRINVPGTVFEEGDNPLAMAGYSELELAMDGTSTTTYSADSVGFDLAVRVDGHDIGSLIVELGADGIPLALFAEVDTEADPDELVPFAENVALTRARIRFEDDSLTGRVLSLMAEAEDTDVDSFVAEGTRDLETMLPQFLEPELARRVSAALTAYLKDPQSLTMALAPAQPVQIAQVLSGLQDPVALIELLQLKITAND